MIRKNIEVICEDFKNIENYEVANADTENMWVCHHRLELDEDGNVLYTKDELIKLGRYFKVPADELIFLKESDHIQLHMNEQQRKKISEIQKNLWKKPKRKRMAKMQWAKRREEGKTMTGIEQLKSDDDYREYQKIIHRSWYKRNKEKWNDYNYRYRLSKKSVEELEQLFNKHLNSCLIAEQCGVEERLPKLKKCMDVIRELIKEKGGSND